MTTFTTEDRELVELLVKTFQPQNDPQANTSENTERGPSKAVAYYRIEDSSEDLDDWPS